MCIDLRAVSRSRSIFFDFPYEFCPKSYIACMDMEVDGAYRPKIYVPWPQIVSYSCKCLYQWQERTLQLARAGQNVGKFGSDSMVPDCMCKFFSVVTIFWIY